MRSSGEEEHERTRRGRSRIGIRRSGFRALRRTEEPQTSAACPMASFKLNGGCCTELLLATGVCDPSPRRAGGARGTNPLHASVHYYMRYSMYQLSRGTGRTYASIDAGDSTALMRFASASSVVGAERFLERDFLGLSAADAVEARGELFGRERPSKSEFSFSTNLMSRSAQRPSSDAFRLLKNQSKLNCQALRISTRMRSQLPYP